MTRKLLALYGLKWNPFTPDVPAAALHVAPAVASFCGRVEHLAREGGFALVTGEPGVGKSVALRILVEHLAAERDLKVGLFSRPQTHLADFYRELGDLFGVTLSPHNRWAGAKALREKWQAHLEGALWRPVLIVDEAQEMQTAVLSELRLLASTQLDSHILLTVVLAGDGRLTERLRGADLLPLASRVRVRLPLERASAAELEQCLQHALAQAGAPKLITPELVSTLCEHAAGSRRTLMIMAGELLLAAAQREARLLDEKLFLEVFAPPPVTTRAERRR
jgi:type II secretory pathway predicted ATPase ExeA